MVALTHVINFLIASALIITLWLAFLYCNNLLDRKLHQGLILDILGTALSLSFILLLGLIVSTYSFSFGTGVLLVALGISIYISIKRVVLEKLLS